MVTLPPSPAATADAAARPDGGALEERVVDALRACHRDTGRPPTSGRYKAWRAGSGPGLPSMTAVVPLAYPTWAAARAAAGVPEPNGGDGRRGPEPTWTAEECLAWVREWLAGDGPESLAAFERWLAAQRAADRPAPSASTVRLRLRLPWSGIVERARA